MRAPRGTTITIRYEDTPARRLKWGAIWYVYLPGQKRPKQKSTWFETEAEAHAFRTATLGELARLAAIPPAEKVAAPWTDGVTRLGPFALDWLRDHVRPHKEAATYRSYEGLLRRHVIPALGPVPLTDAMFTPPAVAKFYEQLYTDGMTLGTRRHVHTCLSSLASYAVFCGNLKHNPCLGLGRFLRHKTESALDPEPNPFTEAEAQLFFDELEACDPDWYLYFSTLHDTGMRVGEIAGLKWANVDLDHRVADIVASYSPSDGCDKDPKTHQRRRIDLTSDLVERLFTWRPKQKREALRRGLSAPLYVFTTKHGTPRRQDGNMRRVFARTLVACQLEHRGLTPHSLRDTFATRHLNTDWGKLPWVSRQLGHETERTTSEHYFKFQPSTATKHYADQIAGGRGERPAKK